MAQLVEQTLTTPEICGSNPIIGKMLSTKLSTNCLIEKTKIKNKRPGMAHLKKTTEMESLVASGMSRDSTYLS